MTPEQVARKLADPSVPETEKALIRLVESRDPHPPEFEDAFKEVLQTKEHVNMTHPSVDKEQQ
jgi:hypothetical protein